MFLEIYFSIVFFDRFFFRSRVLETGGSQSEEEEGVRRRIEDSGRFSEVEIGGFSLVESLDRGSRDKIELEYRTEWVVRNSWMTKKLLIRNKMCTVPTVLGVHTVTRGSTVPNRKRQKNRKC